MPPFLRSALLCLVAGAQGQPPEQIPKKGPSINAEIVWGGAGQREPHAPVVVTLDNPGPEIRGRLILQWGISAAYHGGKKVTPDTLEGAQGSKYEIPIVLPEGARRRHLAYVHGRPPSQEDLWVFLMEDGECLARFAITPLRIRGRWERQPRIGIVGPGGAPGLPQAGAQMAPVRPDQLPDRWFGYESLHALVWLDADAGEMRDGSQVEALRQWVGAGGHLMIARGESVGFKGTFLEKVAPVIVRGVLPHEAWEDLGALAGTPGPSGKGSILQARPRKGATVLVGDDERALIVQADYGLGRVTFAAFDPFTQPFANWDGAPPFWQRVLNIRPPPKRENARQEAYWGGDLGSAVGGAPVTALLGVHGDIPLPSLGWAFFLVFVYVILVGPVDFLVLRRLRKMELTWITFPACVLLFSAIALLSGSTIARHPAQLRETIVIDSIPDADLVRGWSLGSIVSPTANSFTVKAARPNAHLAAYGLSMGFGQSAEGGLRLGADRVEDWIFPHGSTGVALAQWCAKGALITVDRAGPDGITVHNDTEQTIHAPLFVSDGEVYALNSVPPGESRHTLDNRKGPFRLALVQTGYARNPPTQYERDNRYYNYGRRRGYNEGQTAEQIRNSLRLELGFYSFARALGGDGRRPIRGMMADIDVSDWIARGGACFLGWVDGGGVLDFEADAPTRQGDTLMRVLVR